MKILYLNPTAVLGGAERSLLDIVSAVHRAEPLWELNLLAAAGGPLLTGAEQAGAVCTSLPLPPALAALGDSRANFVSGKNAAAVVLQLLRQLHQAPPYAARLRAKVHAIAPDIIHSNGLKTHLLLRFAGARCPVIAHVRDFVGSRKLVRRLLPLLLPPRAHFVVNSAAVRDDLLSVVPGAPCTVIYNGIDTSHFSPGGADASLLDAAAGLAPAPAGIKRIGIVGAFGRWKGQDVFLEAAARVIAQAQVPRPRFYIIGGPIYSTAGSQFSVEELSARADSLGIKPNVGLTGFVENTADCYRALDVVVHCSTQPEPFGRTIVEAMSCGRPVIAAAAGGAKEVFTSGFDAVGITPNDISGLAAAMAQLLQDPALCRTLGENARSTVMQRFSSGIMAAKLLELYHELVSPR